MKYSTFAPIELKVIQPYYLYFLVKLLSVVSGSHHFLAEGESWTSKFDHTMSNIHRDNSLPQKLV